MINEVASGWAAMAITCGLVVTGLLAWFWVNRASVRANEQIRLLQALLEEQKQQNQLLKQLVASQPGADQSVKDGSSEPDFIRLIPER